MCDEHILLIVSTISTRHKVVVCIQVVNISRHHINHGMLLTFEVLTVTFALLNPTPRRTHAHKPTAHIFTSTAF